MGKENSWKTLIEALEEAIPIYEEGSIVASLGTLRIFRGEAVNLAAKHVDVVEVLLDEGVGLGGILENSIAKLKPKIILGLDYSVKMLRMAYQKFKDSGVEFHPVRGIFECLPLKIETISLAIFSFSLRDAINIKQALLEAKTVLKPKGLLLILDVGKPENIFLKTLYGLYWRTIAPLIVKLKLRIRGRNPWTKIYQTYQNLPINNQLKRLISENFKILTFKKYYYGCVIIVLASK